MASSEAPFSLYVHVPFCTDKCLYCNFFSVPCRTLDAAIPAAVVEQTIAQARFLLDALGHAAPPETIFVGGGTPSALPRRELRRLLTSLGHPSCREWTVEANPETIDEEFLDICQETGVTRLSCGVQSMSDRHLRTLRRAAGRADVMRAAGLLRKRWSSDASFDFIAGIPGQTVEDVVEDLTLLDEFPVSHVSLYSLTYEPDTPLVRLVERGDVQPNTEQADEELWFAGVEELVRRGYRQYEVSNFCLPGKECLHNLRYWRLEPYLGVGPGAVSTLPAEPLARALGRPQLLQAGGVVRISNPRDIAGFLGGAKAFWGTEIEPVRPADFLVETLMMGLRLESGIATSQFSSRFGARFDEVFPGLWDEWVKQGMAQPEDGRLALTQAGRMMLDGLLSGIKKEPEEKLLSVSWP